MGTSTKKLCISASIATGLFAGCAAFEPQEATKWTPPAPGSTWQMSQHNTGSFGKDAEVVMTRGDDVVWQGNKVVKMTSSSNGASIMMLPDGKWTAVVAKDGKTLITYDPPIGYEFPLKVGKGWKTHHKATNLASSGVLDFDYSCTVESVDRITVRAGTFDAFKIVCENEYSRDVSWYSRDLGVHVKTDMRRKAGFPNGEGTQQAELVALNLTK